MTTMPEPPNDTMVILIDTKGVHAPVLFERDDSEDKDDDGNIPEGPLPHWYSEPGPEWCDWADVEAEAVQRELRIAVVVALPEPPDPRTLPKEFGPIEVDFGPATSVGTHGFWVNVCGKGSLAEVEAGLLAALAAVRDAAGRGSQ